MISAYPHPQLDGSLRFVITICASVLRLLVSQSSTKEYAALEGRFKHELNQALDMWEQVHDPTSHISISEWVEKELISFDPHPVLLSKLKEAVPIGRRIIAEYEERFGEFLKDFFAKQKRPLFVLEIEVHRITELDPAVAHVVLGLIAFRIVDRINTDYLGAGGMLTDIDSFRFRFEPANSEDVINVARFILQEIAQLKTGRVMPSDLTILIGIGYGSEIDLISGAIFGKGVYDARYIVGSAYIEESPGDWKKIGEARLGKAVCFISNLAMTKLSETLTVNCVPHECEIRGNRTVIYELAV